jgi:multicomponent Na+:H+ antiporter subunit F
MTAETLIISVLGITASLALYRVIFGPTPWDRLTAVNLISSKVVMIMVAAAVFFERRIYLDVALVYAIIGFVSIIAISKFLESEDKNIK